MLKNEYTGAVQLLHIELWVELHSVCLGEHRLLWRYYKRVVVDVKKKKKKKKTCRREKRNENSFLLIR